MSILRQTEVGEVGLESLLADRVGPSLSTKMASEDSSDVHGADTSLASMESGYRLRVGLDTLYSEPPTLRLTAKGDFMGMTARMRED